MLDSYELAPFVERFCKMKSQTVPPQVRRFSPAKQRRMDLLLDKNSEGTITPKEKTVLESLVAEAEQLMVANAKQLAAFSQRVGVKKPADAVAVTVWVSPTHAEQ